MITSRLHCYLPTRALNGAGNVTFTHPNKLDTRFDGLIDIDDDAFDAIRNGLTDLLDKILGKIMAGDANPDEIYTYWRELTMPSDGDNRDVSASNIKNSLLQANKPLVKADAKISGQARSAAI